MLKRNCRFLNILKWMMFQAPRILKYKLLSDIKILEGKPEIKQPVMFLGQGKIKVGKNTRFGVKTSACFYTGYSYIEARKTDSIIEIGDDVWLNNNCSIVCDGAGISIGNKTIMGVNTEIINSDFHELDPEKRMTGEPKTAKITIGENVFFGSNVKVLKGVTIGDNCVIGNSSVVTKSIPANTVAAGNPARVIKTL